MSLVKDVYGKLYYKTEAVGSRSNETVNVWDDGPRGNMLEICVRHDRNKICSLQAMYEGQYTNLLSRRHGGVKGDMIDIITLNGPLTWISGYYGTLPNRGIRSLSFGNDRETYGPFGSKQSDYDVFFSFKSGRQICGFHGSSLDVDGGYLCTIGVYTMTIAHGYVDQAAIPTWSSRSK